MRAFEQPLGELDFVDRLQVTVDLSLVQVVTETADWHLLCRHLRKSREMMLAGPGHSALPKYY